MIKKDNSNVDDNSARYQIECEHIVDTQTYGRSIYIRELIEIGCFEFDRSEIPARERLAIIEAVGQDQIIDLLRKNFARKRRPFDEKFNAIAGIQALKEMASKEENL